MLSAITFCPLLISCNCLVGTWLQKTPETKDKTSVLNSDLNGAPVKALLHQEMGKKTAYTLKCTGGAVHKDVSECISQSAVCSQEVVLCL